MPHAGRHRGASVTLAGALALAGVVAASSSTAGELDWLRNLQDAEARAAVERVPVMIDFYADWCGWCKVLDRRTYTDPSVEQLAARVISVKVNTDLNPALARLYNVGGLPTIVFLDRKAEEITRIVGYKDGPAFATILREVLTPKDNVGLLQAAAQTAPTDPESAYRLGDALLGAALYDDAIRVLAPLAARAVQASIDDPVTPDAALDLGHAYYLNTQYDKAATAYADFTRRFPKNPRVAEAQLYLAHAYMSLGRGKDAVSLYRKVKKSAASAWQGHEAARSLDGLSPPAGG